MGFSVNSFAKIWNIEDRGKYSEVALSVSKKAKDERGNEIKDENGKTVYNIEFSDKFVRFIGKAHELAKTLQVGDSVKLLNCDVSNKYDAEKKTTYVNYAVFDAEASQYNNSNRGGNNVGKHGYQSKPNPANTVNNDFMDVPDDCDEGLPFN